MPRLQPCMWENMLWYFLSNYNYYTRYHFQVTHMLYLFEETFWMGLIIKDTYMTSTLVFTMQALMEQLSWQPVRVNGFIRPYIYICYTKV